MYHVGEAVVDGVQVEAFSSMSTGRDACIGWMHEVWKLVGWKLWTWGENVWWNGT
ncbi:hypothetical protein AAJP84_05860 [Bartonella schoenbuchensis]|uniref:hypothetical protein n=1 Tax=Bartonella schoenbuchensis TaxID=165694 RepID=UPI0031CCBA5C